MTIKADKLNHDANEPSANDRDLFVTVFTDASWCPETKAFGCAYWIKDGNTEAAKTHSWGGYTKKGPEHAETNALLGALDYVEKNISVWKRVVVIQSDCLNALRKLDIRPLHKAGAKHVKLKHVKAHTSHNTKRSKVNQLVDRLAKQQMKQYRG